MDVTLKVTDQPQESSFSDLVSGDNVLSIPLFQRAYRWSQRSLDLLFDDVSEISSDVTKSCFLGVVVCVSRGALPGRPVYWDIVDGQQRLSTLYMSVLAAAEIAARNNQIRLAADIMGTYLLVRPLADNPVNTKLVPSYADRMQFKKIWDNIMAIPSLATDPTIVANPPRPPSPSGAEDGPFLKQYQRILRRFGTFWQEGQQTVLSLKLQILTSKLSVVTISLRDPFVAPKIFERLNNRAELVTVADLVRNEVFLMASQDPARAIHVFTNHWEPFVQRFIRIDNGLEKFLFPYGLVLDHSVTKAELFNVIRTHWKNLESPETIIADMQRFASTFIALELGISDIELPDRLQVRINRIHRLNRPSSTYAFIFNLIAAVKAHTIAVDTVVDVLDVIDTFLFRRAVCGIEPTGLHAVFKGLWKELTSGDRPIGITADTVRKAISDKPTVFWPTNAQFEDAIRTGDLYNRRVAKYALREYESATEGESPMDDFNIEHICPQTPTPTWTNTFADKYNELVHTWANLIPLTPRMNDDAGQEPYTLKKQEYSQSVFVSARVIAEEYSNWTPIEVANRANTIVRWALVRWPHEAVRNSSA